MASRMKRPQGKTVPAQSEIMARLAAAAQGNSEVSSLPVVVAPDKTILVGNSVIIHETSLEFIGEVDRDGWIQLALWLRGLDDTLQWAIGDMVIYADERREAWIEAEGITDYDLETKYKELLESTGYSYSSLTKFATYARRFSPFRRRKGISFSHHVEVAALSDEQQDAWLDLVAETGLSRNDLRAEIAKSKLPAPASNGDSIAPTVDTPSPAPMDDIEEEATSLDTIPLTDKVHRQRMNTVWKKVETDALTVQDLPEVIFMRQWCDRVIKDFNRRK